MYVADFGTHSVRLGDASGGSLGFGPGAETMNTVSSFVMAQQEREERNAQRIRDEKREEKEAKERKAASVISCPAGRIPNPQIAALPLEDRAAALASGLKACIPLDGEDAAAAKKKKAKVAIIVGGQRIPFSPSGFNDALMRARAAAVAGQGWSLAIRAGSREIMVPPCILPPRVAAPAAATVPANTPTVAPITNAAGAIACPDGYVLGKNAQDQYVCVPAAAAAAAKAAAGRAAAKRGGKKKRGAKRGGRGRLRGLGGMDAVMMNYLAFAKRGPQFNDPRCQFNAPLVVPTNAQYRCPDGYTYRPGGEFGPADCGLSAAINTGCMPPTRAQGQRVAASLARYGRGEGRLPQRMQQRLPSNGGPYRLSDAFGG